MSLALCRPSPKIQHAQQEGRVLTDPSRARGTPRSLLIFGFPTRALINYQEQIMKNRLYIYLSLCILAAVGTLFLSCTFRVAGASETGHGSEICGMLYKPNGADPAVSAEVHLRAITALADTSGVLSSDAAFVKTDTSGAYAINDVDTGMYVVEGIDSANNRAIVDSVHVTNKNGPKDLGADTLRPCGAIKGKIYLSEGGDPGKVLILAYGADKLAWADANGSFKVKNFAHGKYKLHILPLLPEYNSLDIGAITVLFAETTDIGTISLPYNGIPVPKNVSLSYDSLKQIVAIWWNRPNSNKNFKGFTVFRRDIDSTTAPASISRTLVTDTAYYDSTAIQGSTCEYAVACVDTLGNLGRLSAGTPVTITSAIQIISAWGDSGTGQGQLFDPQKIAADDSGFVYVADNGHKRVQKFSANGVFVLQFPDTFAQINGMCADKKGTVYIADFSANKIYKYDGNGRLVFSFGNTSELYKDVTVDDNGTIYVLGRANSQETIWTYDSLGNAGIHWQANQNDIAIFISRNSIVYTCGKNLITAYSKDDGAMVSSWTIPGAAVSARNACGIITTATGEVIVSDMETDQILVFAPNGALLAKGGNFANLSGVAMDKNGNLYGAESGKNRIVKIKYQ
jgi:sugar lactone lactonase YvrE